MATEDELLVEEFKEVVRNDIERAVAVGHLLSAGRLLAMRKFARAIRAAARLTRQTGREAGFRAYPHRRRIGTGQVVLGGCAHIGPEHWAADVAFVGLPVVEVHFHPPQDGAIIPSMADLKGLLWWFEEIFHRRVSVMEIIGQVRLRRVDLLFMQVSQQVGPDSVFATEPFPSGMSEQAQGQIVAALKRAGFQAEIRTINL